jgi:perosamine synthetase
MTTTKRAPEKATTNPSKYLGNELEYLRKVLESEAWSNTSGSWTQSLEAQFAKRLGAKYAIGMNSGTATLHAALVACGVKAGDEVISPAITVIMDTTATFHANAVPVYADVDPDTFNIDPEDIARKITPKTKAIIPVSLYGLPCDMDPIMKLAEKHGLAVIEDNAQCVLGTYKGRMLGTIGTCASYSFENTKHISCGEGGMVVTNDEVLAEKVRKIGGHGFKNLRASEGRIRLNQNIFQNPNYKRHDTLGWNYRLPEFNAAVALAQLERVEELVELRVKSAAILVQAMKGCKYLVPQQTPTHSVNSYYTLGVRYLGVEQGVASWEDFRAAYIEEGGDGIYGAWSVPYLEPMMVERVYVEHNPALYKNLRFSEGLCPVAERVQKQLMQFKTNYRDLSLAELKAEALYRTIRRY